MILGDFGWFWLHIGSILASFWSPNGLWDDFVLCWGEDWGSECRFIEILRILGSLLGVILAPKSVKKTPQNRDDIFRCFGEHFWHFLESKNDQFWGENRHFPRESCEMGEHVIFNTPPTKFTHFYGCQGAKIREKTPPGPLWNRSHFKADFWEHFCGILVPIWAPFWHQKPPKIDTRKLLIFGVLLDPPRGEDRRRSAWRESVPRLWENTHFPQKQAYRVGVVQIGQKPVWLHPLEVG